MMIMRTLKMAQRMDRTKYVLSRQRDPLPKVNPMPKALHSTQRRPTQMPVPSMQLPMVVITC